MKQGFRRYARAGMILALNHLNQTSEDQVDGKTEQVSRMILDYIRKNPEAGDTLEGIARWWLEIERIESSVAEIEDALHDLVEKGVIAACKIEGGATLYKTK